MGHNIALYIGSPLPYLQIILSIKKRSSLLFSSVMTKKKSSITLAPGGHVCLQPESPRDRWQAVPGNYPQYRSIVPMSARINVVKLNFVSYEWIILPLDVISSYPLLLAVFEKPKTEVHTDNRVPLLCSLVEWVILALEIVEFHSWGNHQLCGYGSMTRGQMITR